MEYRPAGSASGKARAPISPVSTESGLVLFAQGKVGSLPSGAHSSLGLIPSNDGSFRGMSLQRSLHLRELLAQICARMPVCIRRGRYLVRENKRVGFFFFCFFLGGGGFYVRFGSTARRSGSRGRDDHRSSRERATGAARSRRARACMHILTRRGRDQRLRRQRPPIPASIRPPLHARH